MNCKINIAETFTAAKLNLLFISLGKSEPNLDKLVELSTNRIEKWLNSNSLKGGLDLSSSDYYDFTGAKELLTDSIELWASDKGDLLFDLDLLKQALSIAVDNVQIKIIENNPQIEVNPVINGKHLIDFTNNASIADLLDGSTALLNKLNTELYNAVTSVSFINTKDTPLNISPYVPPMTNFVRNNIALNNNIMGVKSRLWASIVLSQGFNLIEVREGQENVNNTLYINVDGNWILNKELFVKVKGVSKYELILSKLNKNFNALKIKSIINSKNKSTTESYINMLILLNFDNFLKQHFNKKISVNPDSFGTWGLPNNGSAKYNLANASIINATWAKDSEGGTGMDEYESNDFKLISSNIPFKSASGNKIQGVFLDTVKINSIGTILNSIPNTVTFSDGLHTYNISQWFQKIGLGEKSFKEMLRAILADEKSEELNVVRDFIYSINSYLYEPNFGVEALQKIEAADPTNVIDLINIESILFNQIRNTSKSSYLVGDVNGSKKTRIVDPMLMDSKVGVDFSNLYSAFSSKWITSKSLIANDIFWTSKKFIDFIKFIEKFSNIEFSETTIRNYLKNSKNSSESFDDDTMLNLKRYFKSKITFAEDKQNEISARAITEDEWVEALKKNTEDTSATSVLFNNLNLYQLFKEKHNEDTLNVVSEIHNFTGKSFPIITINNVASSLKTIVHNAIIQPKISIEEKQVLNSFEDFTILLEIVNKDTTSEYFNKLSAEDNMSFGFLNLFYGYIINNDKIVIQPYNLSDKSKILAQVVNYTILGKEKVVTSTDAIKLLTSIQKTYFSKLSSNILSVYTALFPQMGFKTIQDIDMFLVGKSYEKHLLPVLEAYNKENQLNPITLLEEIHYSNYDNGIAFNKLLKFNIDIWTNSNTTKLKEYIQYQEDYFAKSMASIDLDITKIGINTKGLTLTNPGSVLAKLKEKFNFTDDDFDITYETREVKKDVIEENPDTGELTSKSITTTEIVQTSRGPKIASVKFKVLDGEGKLPEPLKQYLWTRNLITAQTTNIVTKGTYIHPLKSEIILKADEELTIPNIVSEENERTVAFYKRMAGLGGSINKFKQGGSDGLTPEIIVAYTEDPKASVFNPLGKKYNQKTFDGGILVSPFLVKQFQDAAPGANLSRVMKPLGISITDDSMSFLKCAFFGLSNEMILASANAEYSLYEVMEKMHSIPFQTELLTIFDDTLQKNEVPYNYLQGLLEANYIRRNGKYTRITSIGTGSTLHSYNIMYEDGSSDTDREIKNLFDAWLLFGGPESAVKRGNNFEYSEGSIEIINYLIKLQAVTGNLEFKKSMIGLLIPRQGAKSGMSNVNPVNRLLLGNNEALLTSTFKTDYLGIQLNAAYNSDDHEISEITQLLSALSENNTSSELYNSVYKVMEQSITKSLAKFTKLKSRQKEDMIKIFKRSLNNATGINNAQTILDNLQSYSETNIPFSERVLYKQFISSVIQNINQSFIRKKISGAGMILNMSQGMIKIIEDNKGRTYLSQDLIRLFDKLYSSEVIPDLIELSIPEFQKSRLKIQYVLDNHDLFKNTVYNSWSEVNPLDIIKVTEKTTGLSETYNLREIDDYYTFLNTFENANDLYSFEKIHISTRDLNPSLKSFTYVKQDESLANSLFTSYSILPTLVTPGEIFTKGISKAEIQNVATYLVNYVNQFKTTEQFNNFVYYYINNAIVYKNGFSIDSVRYRFLFDKVEKPLKSYELKLEEVLKIPFVKELNDYLILYNKRYGQIATPEVSFEIRFNTLKKYLEKFSYRSWDIIDSHLMFAEFVPNTNYFKNVLKYTDNNFDNLEYGIDNTKTYSNTLNLFNVVSKDAENISSKLYNTQFQLQGAQHSEITEQFFNKKFNNTINNVKFRHYDILLNNLYDSSKNLQIVIAELQTVSDYESKNPTPIKGKYLIDEEGNLVRTTKIAKEYNFVGHNINISTREKQGVIYRVDPTNKSMYEIDLFKRDSSEEETYNIFRTSSGDIAFTKSQDLGKFIEGTNKYFGIIDILDTKNDKQVLYDSILENSTNRTFKEYIKDRISILSKWIDIENEEIKTQTLLEVKALKKKYFNTRALEMFNSWKLSNVVVAARIPAQAGQSFMSMKTVGYMHEGENTLYVSHWQLWLQGSDFDIDKAYVMKFDVNNGIFEKWSPYFDLSTNESTKQSLLLPAPLLLEMIRYENVIVESALPSTITTEQATDVLDLDVLFDIKRPLLLSDRVSILNYVYKEWTNNPGKYKSIKTKNNDIFKTIRNHNTFFSEEGMNNFRVNQIIKISRSPKNYLSSYTPISLGDYYGMKKESTLPLTLYNPYTMYKQQENNFVGKGVIGISAVGIKSYFALVTYFSNKYSKGKLTSDSPEFFANEYTIGDTTRFVTNIAGLNLTEEAHHVLQKTLYDATKGNKYLKKDGTYFSDIELAGYIETFNRIDDIDQIAIKLSALLSAATDNAKELLLADINAGIDLAGMHIFLMIMGFDEIVVAKFMTSEVVQNIKTHISDSFLNKKWQYGISNTLNTLKTSDITSVYKIRKDALVAKLMTSNLDVLKTIPSKSPVFDIFNLNKKTLTKENLNKFAANFTSYMDFEDGVKQIIAQWESREIQKIEEIKRTPAQLAKINKKSTIILDELLGVGQLIKFQDSLDLGNKEELEIEERKVEGIITNFKKIYAHSKEVAQLGFSLAINGGVKATVEDVYKTTRQIPNIINSQQNIFFKENNPSKDFFSNIIVLLKSIPYFDALDTSIQTSLLGDLNYYGLRKEDIDTGKAKETLKKVIKKGIINAAIQSKKYLSTKYIIKTVNESIAHDYIWGDVDYVKYFNDENYRNSVVNYSNIIKYNFNIADIINNLPHFNSMILAFQSGNNFLEETVLGYKFITKVVPVLATIASLNEEITSYATLTSVKQTAQKDSNVYLNPDILETSQDALYELLLINWFENLNYDLDFSEYIKNIPNIESPQIIENNKAEIKTSLVKEDSKDLFIELGTDYGRAKFKYLMETYIIPNIKSQLKSNKFMQHYNFKSGRGFNMRRVLKHYFNAANYDLLLDLEQDLELISKNIDNRHVMSAKVVKSDAGTNLRSSIPLIDLISIYDKIVNLGRYGGNRATLFFANSKSKESAGAQFLLHQTEKEKNGDAFIEELLEKIVATKDDTEDDRRNKKLYRESLYLSLFGTFKKGEKKYVVKDSGKNSDYLDKGIRNEYFKLVTSIETSIVFSDDMKEKNELKTKIMDHIQILGILNMDCS